MIRWLWVLAQRLLSLCLVAVCGCWADEPLVHGSFTPEQWAGLQQVFAQPLPPDPCALATPTGGWLPLSACSGAARFGQQLFFEPRLSGPWIEDPDTGEKLYPAAKTSCATCHDPAGWYIDTRPDNAVSQGAKSPTPHNTLSLVNVAFERELYTWTGDCHVQPCLTPDDVVQDIALPGAMKSEPAIVARVIREEPSYLMTFEDLFHLDPVTLPADDVQAYVVLALDAYMRRLISLNSPFDRFIRGDDSALDEAQTRGFALFVGRAMCAECHRGGMFTDYTAHVTGVPDDDPGHANTGAFLTPGLRHVEKTGPYMHDGSLDKLADVIEFYRWGGAASGYVGDKDPLMAPLDITDEDAKDLEAFLHALTGEKISDALREDTHVVTTPTPSCISSDHTAGVECDGSCTNLVTDNDHCGSCDVSCGPMQVCMGQCYPVICSPPAMACDHACVDVTTDPANCGGCGNACPADKPTCNIGTCVP